MALISRIDPVTGEKYYYDSTKGMKYPAWEPGQEQQSYQLPITSPPASYLPPYQQQQSYLPMQASYLLPKEPQARTEPYTFDPLRPGIPFGATVPQTSLQTPVPQVNPYTVLSGLTGIPAADIEAPYKAFEEGGLGGLVKSRNIISPSVTPPPPPVEIPQTPPVWYPPVTPPPPPVDPVVSEYNTLVSLMRAQGRQFPITYEQYARGRAIGMTDFGTIATGADFEQAYRILLALTGQPPVTPPPPDIPGTPPDWYPPVTPPPPPVEIPQTPPDWYPQPPVTPPPPPVEIPQTPPDWYPQPPVTPTPPVTPPAIPPFLVPPETPPKDIPQTPPDWYPQPPVTPEPPVTPLPPVTPPLPVVDPYTQFYQQLLAMFANVGQNVQGANEPYTPSRSISELSQALQNTAMQDLNRPYGYTSEEQALMFQNAWNQFNQNQELDLRTLEGLFQKYGWNQGAAMGGQAQSSLEDYFGKRAIASTDLASQLTQQFANQRMTDRQAALQNAMGVNSQIYEQVRGDFADQLSMLGFEELARNNEFTRGMTLASFQGEEAQRNFLNRQGISDRETQDYFMQIAQEWQMREGSQILNMQLQQNKFANQLALAGFIEQANNAEFMRGMQQVVFQSEESQRDFLNRQGISDRDTQDYFMRIGQQWLMDMQAQQLEDVGLTQLMQYLSGQEVKPADLLQASTWMDNFLADIQRMGISEWANQPDALLAMIPLLASIFTGGNVTNVTTGGTTVGAPNITTPSTDLGLGKLWDFFKAVWPNINLGDVKAPDVGLGKLWDALKGINVPMPDFGDVDFDLNFAKWLGDNWNPDWEKLVPGGLNLGKWGVTTPWGTAGSTGAGAGTVVGAGAGAGIFSYLVPGAITYVVWDQVMKKMTGRTGTEWAKDGFRDILEPEKMTGLREGFKLLFDKIGSKIGGIGFGSKAETDERKQSNSLIKFKTAMETLNDINPAYAAVLPFNELAYYVLPAENPNSESVRNFGILLETMQKAIEEKNPQLVSNKNLRNLIKFNVDSMGRTTYDWGAPLENIAGYAANIVSNIIYNTYRTNNTGSAFQYRGFADVLDYLKDDEWPIKENEPASSADINPEQEEYEKGQERKNSEHAVDVKINLWSKEDGINVSSGLRNKIYTQVIEKGRSFIEVWDEIKKALGK